MEGKIYSPSGKFAERVKRFTHENYEACVAYVMKVLL